jgi:hypothetical protein
MKTAVVFSGPVRQVELASKFWHNFGEADYFLITWDKTVLSRITSTFDAGDPTNVVDLDLSNFPKPLTYTIVSDYLQFRETHIMHGSHFPNTCMMHNWSLLGSLPGIYEYDKIILTRTDLAVFPANNALANYIPLDGKSDKIWSQNVQDSLWVFSPRLIEFVEHIANLYLTQPVEIHGFIKNLIDSTNKFLPMYDSDCYTTICRPGFDLMSKILLHTTHWWNTLVAPANPGVMTIASQVEYLADLKTKHYT